MIEALRIRPTELLRLAAAALLAHRLRSALSMLGIVCGIATVVTALAIGEGARRAAIEEIGALGVENVYVRAVPGTDRAGGAVAPVLTRGDAAAIRQALGTVAAVAMTRSIQTEARTGSRRAVAALSGVSASWPEMRRLPAVTGRWFSEREEQLQQRVAVIGGALSRQLFIDGSPIGARVCAGGTWFLIIGTLADNGSGLFVPLPAMDVSLGAGDSRDRVQEIVLGFGSAEQVDVAVSAVRALVAQRHRDSSTYEVVVPQALLAARLRAQRTFNIVLVSIGGLSLLISGVGIMNIMLASVAERTQEVGVRRAFGARREEIVAQFACEAAMLCLAGAVVGVPLGGALSLAVSLAAGWPVTVSAWSVLLAFSLATAVGLVFGIYPAKRASEITPVDALRAT